jgi:hypothetical protein
VPDLPPSGPDRKSPVTIAKPRQRADRPPPCRQCQGPSWWNGWRLVFPTVAALVAGMVEHWELPLARAKCSRCKHGFTCYPPGIYPRRQYQLDVVAEACATVTLGAQSAADTAGTIGSSATSVRRWIAWLAALAQPRDLVSLTARLDADAPAGQGLPPPAGGASRRWRAAQVLAGLEQVGAALLRRGLSLVARTGLARVLSWQYEQHGDVYGLVAGVRQLSPAMALGRSPGGQ